MIGENRDAVKSPVRIAAENQYLDTFHSLVPGMTHAFYNGSGSQYSHQIKQYIFNHTYHGRNQYVEYVMGNIPIVISAPHGGRLKVI